MGETILEDSFIQEVRRLRAAYLEKRDSTNLCPPIGRPTVDLSVDMIDGITYSTFWYENNGEGEGGVGYSQCIRLASLPNTLSGDILCLRQNLPSPLLKGGNFEIIGDEVRALENAPPLPPELEDDSEGLSDILASLPVVEVDPRKHSIKKGNYKSEVQNLLKCQGGSCPGVVKSDHIVQLLGKSSKGELVFEKFNTWTLLAASVYTLAQYKRWILQLISGLKYLHSLGIIHRDLRLSNILFSFDSSRLLICDIESRWGRRLAPEVSRDPDELESGWTEKSDIYDLGILITHMIYGNNPLTNEVELPVPYPLDAIVAVCTRYVPEKRPSLDELYAMVDRIIA